MEEEEKLTTFLTIVPLDEEKMDYDTLNKKYPIVDWEYRLLGRMEARDMEVFKIIRADKTSSFHGVSQDFFRRLDRQDLQELYEVAKEKAKDQMLEGHDLVLWGDLKTLFDSSVDDDIWKNQDQWNVKNWNFYESCGVHVLQLEDGTEIPMLAERKYPLEKGTLEKMMIISLSVDEESEVALDLVRYILKQIEEK